MKAALCQGQRKTRLFILPAAAQQPLLACRRVCWVGFVAAPLSPACWSTALPLPRGGSRAKSSSVLLPQGFSFTIKQKLCVFAALFLFPVCFSLMSRGHCSNPVPSPSLVPRDVQTRVAMRSTGLKKEIYLLLMYLFIYFIYVPIYYINIMYLYIIYLFMHLFILFMYLYII